MLTLIEVLNEVAASPGFRAVNHVSVNSRGKDGQTPLHWMASRGDLAGVRMLLDAGADFNAQDDEGNTPLHEAVMGRKVHVARVLIEHGADEGIRNKAGLTAVDIAQSEAYGPTIELAPRGGTPRR